MNKSVNIAAILLLATWLATPSLAEELQFDWLFEALEESEKQAAAEQEARRAKLNHWRIETEKDYDFIGQMGPHAIYQSDDKLIAFEPIEDRDFVRAYVVYHLGDLAFSPDLVGPTEAMLNVTWPNGYEFSTPINDVMSYLSIVINQRDRVYARYAFHIDDLEHLKEASEYELEFEHRTVSFPMQGFKAVLNQIENM